MSEKEYLTVAEVSTILNIAQTTIILWIKEGKIKGAKRGFRKRWLIPNDITLLRKIKKGKFKHQIYETPPIPGKISPKQASERWGVRMSLIYKAATEGKIPGAEKIGNLVYVADLDNLIYIENGIYYTSPFAKAKEMSLSEATIRRMCVAGQMKGAFKRGKQWLIPTNVAPAKEKLEHCQKMRNEENYREGEIWYPHKDISQYKDYVFGQDDIDNINSIHARIARIMREKFGSDFTFRKLCKKIEQQTGQDMGKIDISFFSRMKHPVDQYYNISLVSLYRIANALDCSLSDLLPTRSEWQEVAINTKDYLTAAELANLWGVSKKRVQVLCKEGRVPGAKKIGNIWVAPRDADKPEDPRRKTK